MKPPKILHTVYLPFFYHLLENGISVTHVTLRDSVILLKFDQSRVLEKVLCCYSPS